MARSVTVNSDIAGRVTLQFDPYGLVRCRSVETGRFVPCPPDVQTYVGQRGTPQEGFLDVITPEGQIRINYVGDLGVRCRPFDANGRPGRFAPCPLSITEHPAWNPYFNDEGHNRRYASELPFAGQQSFY